MPCYDGGYGDSLKEEKLLKEFEHNSPVAEILCDVCLQMTDAGLDPGNVSEKLRVWWEEHKKRDKNK